MAAPVGELRDIRGLDPAPWWPPGPGWLLILLGLALAALLWWAWQRRRDLARGIWRLDARRRLGGLERRLSGLTAREAAGELSELLRRTAMGHYGRAACAGIIGEDWLAWLEARDPRGFPWRSEGRLLLTLPYAPPAASVGDGELLRPLVRAALAWTRDDPLQEPRPLGEVAHG